MDEKFLIKIFLTFLLGIIVTTSWGQTTIFDVVGGGTLPIGWTSNNTGNKPIDKGSYYLVEAKGSLENIITKSYNLSAYAKATLSVDIKSFGAGAHNKLKIEVSIDGGTTYTQSYVTEETTRSYSKKTINIITVSANIIIKFSNNSTSGRGVRMKNIKLVANGVVGSTVSFDTDSSTKNETNATFTTNIPVSFTNYTTPVTINITVDGVSTAESTDYTLNTSSLTFNANETKNISLNINSDADTDNETVILKITVTSGTANLGRSQYTITIIDDEAPPKPSLIISEVADPKDKYKARFVEIYNNGTSTIDLTTEKIYFIKQTNGRALKRKILTGTIKPNTVFIIGKSSEINTNYGFNANINTSYANGNGDDGYFLYFGGNETTGTLLDAYGVIDEDGSGKPWEYKDKRAYRKSPKTVNPNTTWTASEWIVETANKNSVDMTPGALENEYRYDGDWKPRSYTNAKGTDDVLILSNVTLPNNITAKQVEIEAGKSFIANGTVTGNITYKVNLADTKWHLVSSPVLGEQYDNAWVTANSITINGLNRAISTYNNLTDTDGDWEYYQGGSTKTFSSGIGYSVHRNTSGELAFTGTYTSGDIFPTITQSSRSNGNDWNFLGNPYSSYLDIDKFITKNTANFSTPYQSIYVWDGTTYVSKTTGYLHPGQGFFVNADKSTAVTFTSAMQSHQTEIMFYKITNSNFIINLKMTDGSRNKTTEIIYQEGRTTGLDPRFDIGSFTGTNTNFSLFSHLVSNSTRINFMKQSLPNSNYKNIVVPLGVNAPPSTEITFTATITNLPDGLNVYLEDRTNNTFTKLNDNGHYTLTLNLESNGIGQFYLRTSSNRLSTNNYDLENISIYKPNNKTLRIIGVQSTNASIKLFTILGKQIMCKFFNFNGIKDIRLPSLSTGIYIVQLQTEKGKLNKKIVIE